MPLESLPDVFDDATHKRLDTTVNWEATDCGVSSPLALLGCIVRHSSGYLNPKYSDLEETLALIKTHGELRDMLVSAWGRKSYREIRNLAILKNPSAVRLARSTMSDTEPEMVYFGLSNSFKAKYYGAAVEGFYEYLTENETLFRDAIDPPYYAKFCAIVQSSGTGKSRMLTELHKKDVVVVYMNLRTKTDVRSFPARDSIPANILTEFPDVEAYQLICYAFFTALFEALDEQLRDSRENVMEWARKMSDVAHVPTHTTRSDFFAKVLTKYYKIHVQLIRLPNRTSITNASSDTPFSVLSSAHRNLGAAIKKIFPDGTGIPRVVIAFDEAHPLTPPSINYPGGYRPADILCRIVSEYSHATHFPVWVVFVSTTSRVADVSPPNEKHNSERIARGGYQLFPPYTQLGWDQSAAALKDIPLEQVSRLHHIVGYGRPLWRSLMTALQVPSEVIRTASWKLCGGEARFQAEKVEQVLAVMGQRFALSVSSGHPDSVGYLETGVASHLRIGLGTTLDRCWRFTNYPSEPLLSCVAAMSLHDGPTNLNKALEIVLREINRGMIDLGERGELASRLLWLLAKDLYVRTSRRNTKDEYPESWVGDLLDCKMIPVVDWLEFVFGPRVWDMGSQQTSVARNDFENAYLNFSHWVCMDENINGSRECDELDLDDWTQRHWRRTSAVQCCRQQPLVDKVIPVYFKGELNTATEQPRMSQIFIQDQVRRSISSKPLLGRITRRSEHLSGRDEVVECHDPPYIAILADLGQPPSSSVNFPDQDEDDRCMRIYAGGIDATTYPFLGNYPQLMEALQTFVRLQQGPETKKPYTEYLNAQMNFGSMATPRHLHWEQWKMVPELPREPAA